jgi:hypothetical protein
MRIRIGLALGVLLAVAVAVVAGCGKSNGTRGVATANSGSAASRSAAPDAMSDQEHMIRFAQCMRDNGVPDFPDPKDGNMNLPNGADPQKVAAAQEKCKHLLPNGGQPRKTDPQQMEQLRKFAQCMRDNGIKNFPDPTDQGLALDPSKLGISPNDPKFTAAQQACSKYQPGGPSGGPSGGGFQTSSNQ